MAPAPTSDIVFWAQGFGAWGRFNGDGNAASVRRDLAGFITGVDTRVGDERPRSASRPATPARATISMAAAARTSRPGTSRAMAAGALARSICARGGAYAFHTIDTDRTIAFPGFFDRATAHYDGGTGQIFGEAGYGFAFGKVAVEPFAGGAWVRLDTDACGRARRGSRR